MLKKCFISNHYKLDKLESQNSYKVSHDLLYDFGVLTEI